MKRENNANVQKTFKVEFVTRSDADNEGYYYHHV